MNGTVEAGMTTAFGKVMPVQIVEFDGPWASVILSTGNRATVKRTSLIETTPAPKATEAVKCDRCAGTGQFITYIENGTPKGPGGICFRCEGKGVQTEADRRRNWGYDNFGIRVE